MYGNRSLSLGFINKCLVSLMGSGIQIWRLPEKWAESSISVILYCSWQSSFGCIYLTKGLKTSSTHLTLRIPTFFCITHKHWFPASQRTQSLSIIKTDRLNCLEKRPLLIAITTEKKNIQRLLLYWPNEQVLDVTPAGTNSYHWTLKG